MWATVALVVGITTAGVCAVLVYESRCRVARRPGVFRCRIRRLPPREAAHRVPWPRHDWYAEWVHDVLIVHRGPVLGTTEALAVRFPEGLIVCSRGMGLPKALELALRLRLDDNKVVQVAARRTAREQLAGPFLAVAALDDIEAPRGPSRDHAVGSPPPDDADAA